MRKAAFNAFINSVWLSHSLCCVLALAACIPLLWPTLAEYNLQATLQPYAGPVILGAFVCSAVLLGLSIVHHLLHMRNLRALWLLCAWLLQWGLAALIFAQMAIEADVSSPYEADSPQPIQQTDTLYNPADKLTGPSALTISISPENYNADTIGQAPNLVQLEREHQELLASFLKRSGRWAYAAENDTFYTRPGHVVLIPPSSGGIPGTVHATFRSVTEGERLPAGFVVVLPGGAFPEPQEGGDGVPDIALELSGKHYLLLAWRGTKHAETARKAINAAIDAIDSRMQRLAESPTEETAALLCEGRKRFSGNKPELRLSEPSSQYGIYQAEVYANPGRPGTLLLAIRETESGKTLRVFSLPALYSDNPNEVFRHDIPGTTEEWQLHSAVSEADTLFPRGAPYFAICTGESHRYFGVTFEVKFYAQGTAGKESETLLRRNYKVQAYENNPAP